MNVKSLYANLEFITNYHFIRFYFVLYIENTCRKWYNAFRYRNSEGRL